jgi:hypothetical protein
MRMQRDRVFVVTILIAMVGCFAAALPFVLIPLLLVMLYRFH